MKFANMVLAQQLPVDIEQADQIFEQYASSIAEALKEAEFLPTFIMNDRKMEVGCPAPYLAEALAAVQTLGFELEHIYFEAALTS